jgi:hypothetical protein
LIDWSDPEAMLGLLVEYVADEANTAGHDPERVVFLESLLEQLEAVAAAELSDNEIAVALREVRHAQGGEFVADAVIDHLDACIEELDRITTERADRASIRP